MRHIKKLVAVTALAASTALLPMQSAEARGGRGIGLGIAGAIIGSALIAGAYGHNRYYGHDGYYGRRHYYDGPRYVYGSSYYHPRRHYRHDNYYYRPWRHRHWNHW